MHPLSRPMFRTLFIQRYIANVSVTIYYLLQWLESSSTNGFMAGTQGLLGLVWELGHVEWDGYAGSTASRSQAPRVMKEGHAAGDQDPRRDKQG
jgi:hypothetical protein